MANVTKRFAEVKAGVVVGVGTGSAPAEVWATEPMRAGLVEVPDDGVDYLGRTYDAATKTFGQKPAPPPVRVISRLDFAQLFTAAERIAIRKRRATADAVADNIDDFYSLLDFTDAVHLDRAIVAAGLTYMAAQGLLTAARKDAILANQPPA